MLYLVRMKDDSSVRSLERITANLVPRASAALTLAVNLTEDSKTDTINRAIQIYAYLMRVKEDGGAFYVEDGQGNSKRIEFL